MDPEAINSSQTGLSAGCDEHERGDLESEKRYRTLGSAMAMAMAKYWRKAYLVKVLSERVRTQLSACNYFG